MTKQEQLDTDIKATLKEFEITEGDLELIKAAGSAIFDDLPDFINDFYDWLRCQPNFEHYFHSEKLVEHVKGKQLEQWQSFYGGHVDDTYFKSRRHIGAVHAQIDLSNNLYFAAMSKSQDLLSARLRMSSDSDAAYMAMQDAVNKLMMLETYIVIDEIARIQKERITEHSRAVSEMSTPVTPIWDGILLLPLVGIMDSMRTAEIMDKSLAKIAEYRAKVFVLDISGVVAVDTAVANQLVKITKAAQLMGCKSVISGLSPSVARTLVELGVSMSEIETTSTLRDGFEIALRFTGGHVSNSQLKV